MVALNVLLPMVGGALGGAALDAAKEGVQETVSAKAKEGAQKITESALDPVIDYASQSVNNVVGGVLPGGQPAVPANQAPKPAPNSKVEQLLNDNDLGLFPNIKRALADPNGRNLIDELFHNIEPIESIAPPVDPKSLLTPSTNLTPIDDDAVFDENGEEY